MKEDFIRAEFHVHTRYSKDSILNKFFILFMCKIRKIKLLAITDHNEIRGAQKYKKFLKRFNIDVIVGEEIMTQKGEIIGLYLTEKIKDNQTVEETIKQIKNQGGLTYLPHPYDEKRYKTVLQDDMQKKFKDYFDFIEIHNGRNIKESFDDEQKKRQELLDINPIIGSDAHTFIELGRNYVLLKYNGKDNLIKDVEDGTFHTKKCIKIAHYITKLARIITMVEKGDFDGIHRIIIKKRKGRK
ncbi:MAG: PHP domain-containing protein [Clostridia bacterium]|nr:PHP domain-containing protein [Clostridia bacterium]